MRPSDLPEGMVHAGVAASSVLDGFGERIAAAARRGVRRSMRADIEATIRQPWRIARVLPYVHELPPESVIPALKECRDHERWLIRNRSRHADVNRALAAQAALVAVRCLRRFGQPNARRAA
jgi:hypothetical protein